jgi:hypothetical protein
MTTLDIFNGYGIEVTLTKEDDFLKIKETLTRMGVASKKEKKLFQSCHILHKRGRYAIIHFKELFMLDGKEANFTADDKARRNTIVSLLEEWGLVTLKDESLLDDTQPMCEMNQLKVLPHSQKREWQLVSKYTIGAKI